MAIRDALAASLLLASAPAFAQTSTATLQAASIVSSRTLDVTAPPATVTMHIRASATTGLGRIRFALRSPSGHQHIVGAFDASAGQGAAVTAFDGPIATRFGGGGLGPHGLNLYSEPGIWTLESISACDVFRLCSIVRGADLRALVLTPTVTVVNNGSPVSALPVVTSASIVATTIQQQSFFGVGYTVPPFKIALTAASGAPGIVEARAEFGIPVTPPSTVNPCIGVGPIVLELPRLGAPTTALAATINGPPIGCGDAKSLLGRYTLKRLAVADQAGNVLDVSDPAKLAELFLGGTTITVTP